MAAFFVLVESVVAGFSRVILQLPVGVVKFAVGGVVDARVVCGCGTLARSLCLNDHPHHSSLRCLER